jgi:hypothetical protein
MGPVVGRRVPADRVRAHSKQEGVEMSDIEYSCDFENTLSVLKLLYDKVDPSKLRWVLTGSTSLILQGVDVPVSNDIDVLASPKDCVAMDGLLAQWRVRAPFFSATDKYQSCLGVYNINGVKIDLMGDFQYKLASGFWSPIRPMDGASAREIEGMRLNMFTLEQELLAYEEMNRKDKILAIRNKLYGSRTANDNRKVHYSDEEALKAIFYPASLIKMPRPQYTFSKHYMSYAAAACFALGFFLFSAVKEPGEYMLASADVEAIEDARSYTVAKPTKRPRMKTRESQVCAIEDVAD